MISIIICSRTSGISTELKANIESTIGVEHELIAINNSDGRYSIFEAYNIGVQKSSYPYLCFMHDDITYKTDNWGAKVIAHFEDDNVGAIGIAGSPFLTAMPGTWWTSGFIVENILQSNSSTQAPVLKTTADGTTNKMQVMGFDGVWFCIRRSLFQKISFDEKTFNSFHFYDTDICMQLNQVKYKIFSVYDILIHHFSQGNLDSSWMADAVKFSKKWRRSLPASCIPVTYTQRCRIEFKALSEFLLVMKHNGVPPKVISKWALLQTLKFYKSYFFYKTPGYIFKYLAGSLKNSGNKY